MPLDPAPILSGAPRRLTARMLVAAVAVGAVVATVGVGLLLAIANLRDAGRDARHSEQVIAQANLLERLVLDLETGERGYVITRQDLFLEPWLAARRQLPPATRRLQRLVVASPAEEAAARKLTADIRGYSRNWTSRVVEAARRRPADARRLVATAGGKRRVDAMRRSFRALIEEEQRLSDRRRRDADNAAFRAQVTAIAGFAFALVLFAFFTGYLARVVVRPVKRVANAARTLASGDLTTRVPGGGPTEIADLARSFNRMARSIEKQQAQLTAQNDQLRELDGLKDEFVAVVSHELRTPLTSIRGYLDLVLDGSAGELSEKQERFLEVANRNSQRLLRLVGDLLLFAQIQAGKFRLSAEPVDAVDVARDAVGAVAPAAEAKSVSVVLDDGVPSPLVADRARLGQVLDNLLSNAVKFTPEGGRVVLRVRPQQDEVLLEVEDNGLGIPPDEVERLFDRFFRSSKATLDAVPGTGLGLAIVKALVEAHGGRIVVESVEGSGTTFSVSLPRRGAEEVRT